MAEDSLPCSKRVKKEVSTDEFLESWSSTQIKVVKLRHTWTINNFSFCSQINGEKLVSPTFSTGINGDKSEWYLYLYPKGKDKEDGEYVGCFLSLVYFNMREIQAKYKFGILNDQGETVNIMHNAARFEKGKGWGFPKFVKQEFLLNEENEVLLDDKLTIVCEIIATVGSGNISGTLTTPESNLAIDFTFLLENKNFSDVTLSAGEKEFPAHKVILTARSPVFKAMFQHDMEESRNNRVKITDIDEEGLCELLRYMYTGKVNKLEKMAPSLLSMAEKYAMDDLKITCQKALFKSLSLDNVAEIFILSDKFGATELKTQVKEFIAAHASVIGNTSEFQSMVRAYPHLSMEAFFALNGNSSINVIT